ncbi:MAG: TIGR02646 family protein [Acidobacteria bacterium]|nr:TIGR02646 family protein [Acidobacteriota bacterium]
MRNIVKGAEPKSLEEYRCSTGATYDDYNDKPTLRESLVIEQRGLCCYCLSRISVDPQKMKIEHWQSQAGFPEHQLCYANLLGACLGGGIGKPPKLQHCDTRKGDQAISLNPANVEHDVERILHYDKDGTIRSTDPTFDREINEVLNLNLPLLKNNRKAILQRLILEGPRRGNWNSHHLEKKLAEWNGEADDSELKEYCQVIVYWLRKRLRKKLG